MLMLGDAPGIGNRIFLLIVINIETHQSSDESRLNRHATAGDTLWLRVLLWRGDCCDAAPSAIRAVFAEARLLVAFE